MALNVQEPHISVKPGMCENTHLRPVQNVQASVRGPMLRIEFEDLGSLGLQNRIRAVRKRRGMTLKEVGAAIGVSHGTISRIERGEMRLDDNYLDLIARALGCEPVELLTDTPVAKTETQAELFRTIAELPDDSAAALLAAASAMRKG